MTKIISELLGAREPLFSIDLQQLERASAHPGVDIRLTADILAKSHHKLRELGLDPYDTTPEELYIALRNLVRLHDHFLARQIGAKDPNDVNDVLPRIRLIIDKMNIPKTAWVLKQSTAKRLLKSTPPKKVMKALGYRSLDSMLKREPIGALFGAIRFIETEQWLNDFISKYAKLQPSDFETRAIEIIQLDHKKWTLLAKDYVRTRRHNILEVKELGVVVMMPMDAERMPGLTITVLPLLVHYINEIRMYSAYLKLQQVRSDFGTVVVKSLNQTPGLHAVVAGHEIHWRIVQRHYGRSHQTRPDIFEPHIHSDDLSWRSAEAVLCQIEPALYFWIDMEYVAVMSPDGPVSFNLLDMAINYVNQLPYKNRVSHHFRSALTNELYGRYMGRAHVEKQILKHYDNSGIELSQLASAMRIGVR